MAAPAHVSTLPADQREEWALSTAKKGFFDPTGNKPDDRFLHRYLADPVAPAGRTRVVRDPHSGELHGSVRTVPRSVCLFKPSRSSHVVGRRASLVHFNSSFSPAAHASVPAVGIADVWTAPEARGRGYAKLLMDDALASVAEQAGETAVSDATDRPASALRPPLAILLHAAPGVAPMYAKLGFTALPQCLARYSLLPCLPMCSRTSGSGDCSSAAGPSLSTSGSGDCRSAAGPSLSTSGGSGSGDGQERWRSLARTGQKFSIWDLRRSRLTDHSTDPASDVPALMSLHAHTRAFLGLQACFERSAAWWRQWAPLASTQGGAGGLWVGVKPDEEGRECVQVYAVLAYKEGQGFTLQDFGLGPQLTKALLTPAGTTSSSGGSHAAVAARARTDIRHFLTTVASLTAAAAGVSLAVSPLTPSCTTPLPDVTSPGRGQEGVGSGPGPAPGYIQQTVQMPAILAAALADAPPGLRQAWTPTGEGEGEGESDRELEGHSHVSSSASASASEPRTRSSSSSSVSVGCASSSVPHTALVDACVVDTSWMIRPAVVVPAAAAAGTGAAGGSAGRAAAVAAACAAAVAEVAAAASLDRMLVWPVENF